jgi:transcriptional regulator
MFLGLHAYTSPSYYESTDGVPTWNYLSVHAYRVLSPVGDDLKKSQPFDLTKHFEGSTEGSWSPDQLPSKLFQGMLGTIQSFELSISEIQAKGKVSQNRSVADQLSVIKHLEDEGQSHSLIIAKVMRERLPDYQ